MKPIFLIFSSFIIIISCKDTTDDQLGKSTDSSPQSRIDCLDDDDFGSLSIFMVCGDFLLQYSYSGERTYNELYYYFKLNSFYSKINITDSLRAKYGLKKDEWITDSHYSFGTNKFHPNDYLTIIDESNQEIRLTYLIEIKTKRSGKIIKVNDRILYFSPSKQTVKLNNGYFSKAIVPKIVISLSDSIVCRKYRVEYYTSLGEKLSKEIFLGFETIFVFPEHLSVDYITFSRAGLDTLLKDIDKTLSKTDIPRIYKLR